MQEKRPQETVQPLADDVLHYVPDQPLKLDKTLFVAALRTAPRGSAPGPGSCTYEHLKLFLGDDHLLEEKNKVEERPFPKECEKWCPE